MKKTWFDFDRMTGCDLKVLKKNFFYLISMLTIPLFSHPLKKKTIDPFRSIINSPFGLHWRLSSQGRNDIAGLPGTTDTSHTQPLVDKSIMLSIQIQFTTTSAATLFRFTSKVDQCRDCGVWCEMWNNGLLYINLMCVVRDCGRIKKLMSAIRSVIPFRHYFGLLAC